MRTRSRTWAACSGVKLDTSMWVTPAYRRSAPPGGQHISSTQPNSSSAAKARTSSRVNSGRMALTNPSCMGGPFDQRTQGRRDATQDSSRTASVKKPTSGTSVPQDQIRVRDGDEILARNPEQAEQLFHP